MFIKKYCLSVSLLGVLTSTSASALTLSCTVDAPETQDQTLLIVDSLTADCGDRKVEISGVGFGLRHAQVNLFTVTCAGVGLDEENDPQFKPVSFVGIRADLALQLAGLNAGIFVSHRGFCAIGGVSLGDFGTPSAAGSVLTIK